MLKKLAIISIASVMLSGCYMVPMAFIGPATSGFSTASILQSTITSGANYVVKKSTGKTITQHALESLGDGSLQQSFLPKDIENKAPKKLHK